MNKSRQMNNKATVLHLEVSGLVHGTDLGLLISSVNELAKIYIQNPTIRVDCQSQSERIECQREQRVLNKFLFVGETPSRQVNQESPLCDLY